MNTPGNNVSPVPVGNILLLVSAIIGGILSQRLVPLDSRRPELEARSSEQPSSQKIVSRLWEDPFEVMARWESERAAKSDTSPVLSLAEILSRKDRKLVVPVIMDPSHYPEVRESRIQQRYAVLAALNASGYERDNVRVMGVGLLEIEGQSILVPYEWFARARMKGEQVSRSNQNQKEPAFEQPPGMADQYDHVCLLWLEDDFLKTRITAIQEPGQGPLSDYRKLVDALGVNVGEQGLASSAVRVVGPRYSDDIQRILGELNVFRGSESWFLDHCAELTEHIEYLKEENPDNVLQSLSEDMAASVSQATNGVAMQRGESEELLMRLHRKYQKAARSDGVELVVWDQHKAGTVLTNYAGALLGDGAQAFTTEFLLGLVDLLEAKETELQHTRGLQADLAAKNIGLREEAAGGAYVKNEGAFADRYELEWRVLALSESRDSLRRMIFTNLLAGEVESTYPTGVGGITGLRAAVESFPKNEDGLALAERDAAKLQYKVLIETCRAGIATKWFFHRKSLSKQLKKTDRSFRDACASQGEIVAAKRLVGQVDQLCQGHLSSRAISIDELETIKAHYEGLSAGIRLREENIANERLPMSGVLTDQMHDPVCSLFSPWATADHIILSSTQANDMEDLLSKLRKSRTEAGQKYLADIRRELLVFHDVHFNRTIHKDSYVVRFLLGELDQRGVFAATKANQAAKAAQAQTDFWDRLNPGTCIQPSEDIVLVGEWDSLFSRALSLSFALEYTDLMSGMGLESSGKDWPDNIHVFSYLRGIDGLMPGKKHTKAPADTDADEEDPFRSLPMRYPDGTSQYDYLRRLASHIRQMDATGRKVKAIGIFGSDPYDKLLILRALRKEIPDAVFFTTDLDARFSHPSELDWTRGLVVGASYGLELQPELQQSTPPFRNSYQTAIYATMLPVLNGGKWAFDIDQYNPRIFEIGFNGPYDLSRAASCSLESSGADFLRLHPDNMNGWDKHKTKIKWSIGFGLMLPTLLLALVGWFWANRESPGLKRNAWVWGAFIGVGLGASGWLLNTIKASAAPNLAGEPLIFTDGISIWPSLIIRMLVFILSFYFMLRCYFSIRSDRERIKNQFGLLDCNGARKGHWHTFLTWPFSHSQPDPVLSVAAWWEEYSTRRKIGLAYLCLFVGTILYGRLSSLVVLLDPPNTPFRGDIAWSAHLITLMVSLIAMSMLCAITIYTLFRCARFISGLYTSKAGRYHSCRWKPVNEGGQDDPVVHVKNMQLISRVTETTGRIVVCPFIVLFIMMLSRYDKIDLWDWPLPLLCVVSLTVLGSLIAAVYMRHKARQAQARALRELKRMQLEAGGEGNVQFYISEVQGCNRGAFAPLTSNPILLAVLTPLGGIGMISIIQSLFTSF